MKKNRINIEELKKTGVHGVPDDYFEKLPNRIMTRVEAQKKRGAFSFPEIQPAVKWSLLVAPAILIIVLFNVLNTEKTLSGEELLASVETSDLIAYLEASDISTEEIISYSESNALDLEFDDSDANLLNGLDLHEESIDDILDDYNIENEIL